MRKITLEEAKQLQQEWNPANFPGDTRVDELMRALGERYCSTTPEELMETINNNEIRLTLDEDDEN